MSPTVRLPPAVLRPAIRGLQRAALRKGDLLRNRRALALLGRTMLTRAGSQRRQQVIAGVPCEVMVGRGAAADRLIVHAHGGGYTAGDPPLLRAWASAVSEESGATVVLPDYRLAPEHPAPAARMDVRAVWDELAERGLDGTAPAALVVSGDSAGGGLALGLAQATVGDGHHPPAGVILVAPWLDLTVDRRQLTELVARDILLDAGWLGECVEAYAADRDPADPQVSPLLGELGGLPPILVQCGTDDMLLPDSDRFVTEARLAGTDVTYLRAVDMWHDFPVQAGLLAAADRAVTQAARFARARLDQAH